MSSKHYKRCYRCEEFKPLEGFPRNASKPDGLADECRPCRVKVSAEYDARNADKVKARKRAYFREYQRRRRAAG